MHRIDLTGAVGKYVVIVELSGCSKSTLLRMVAGLKAPTSDRIEIGSLDVTGLFPR